MKTHTSYAVSKALDFLGWVMFSNLRSYRRLRGGIWRKVFVDPPIADTMWLNGTDTSVLEHELEREDYTK